MLKIQLERSCNFLNCFVIITHAYNIYIYAYSRRFYSKQLFCIQVIHLYCQYVCSLGIEPTTFALLAQCSTTEPQEHKTLQAK